MAQMEPLDVKNGFEDKENLLLHGNVLPRPPCPEKGYEELDVSELSMKLRYSITPASSPMSKSYTANCRDNKHYEAIDDTKSLSVLNSNNLTHSLNSSLKINENMSNKVCPLQPLPTDVQNPVRKSMDMHPVDTGIKFSISENHTEEDSLLPSPSSSANLTPEATTPTKEILKDGGSPILRGLKSVFSMFRSSQSPIPPTEVTPTCHVLSPTTEASAVNNPNPQPSLISTPILKTRENSSKRNSPLKESLTFKDDLEKELLWKEESTILFKDEKIPIHKLFLQQPLPAQMMPIQNKVIDAENNMSLEYMDISQNDSAILDATMTDLDVRVVKNCTDIINHGESDGEFVDCETTFTKNDSLISNPVDEIINENEKVTETEQQNKEQTNNREFSEINQVINEIMAVNHDSTMEIIKNIDSSIEMLTANQFKDNQVTDVSVVCENNIKDQMPDVVNIPVAINPTSVDVTSTSNYIKKVDTNIQKYNTFECSSEALGSLNKEALSTSSQIENDVKSTDMTKNYNFGESINNVLDISIREYEPMDVSEDNSKIIADLSTVVDETYEIITKNNGDSSNLDNIQEQNYSLSEQPIIDKLDENLTIPNTDNNLPHDITVTDSLKTCETEPAILCTKDDETLEVISDVDRVKEASENDTTYEKEEKISLEGNKQCHTLYQEIVSNNDTGISNSYDLSFNIKDSNTLVVEKENTILPANIPLPCDTDVMQELVTDCKSVKNDSKLELFDSSDITDFKCTYSQAECVQEKLNINKSSNQSVSAAKICEIDNEISKTSIKHTNNVTQLTKCEIVSKNSDNVDDKLDICNKDNVESVPNSVVQFTNEDTFDIDKNKALGSLDVKLCMNERGNSIFINNEPNDTIENIKLTPTNSEKDLTMCSTTSNDVVQNDQVKIEYDEEMITSASSSPYVSVTDMAVTSLAQDRDNIENPFETKNKVDKSPPISPYPSNKGYNFNFDDIEDPFATKTKIRLSPTPESSTLQSCTPAYENKNCKFNDSRRKDFHKNKRKSHPEKVKKCFTNTKSLNKTNSNRILVEHRNDDNVKSLLDEEKLIDPTLSIENIDENRQKDNLDDNTEITLNKMANDSIADDVGLKIYENEQVLCDSNKTQEIGLTKKEIVIDNMTEIFQNTKFIKTNVNSKLKEIEGKKDDNNTYSDNLFKNERSEGEIKEFDHIENTFYKFSKDNMCAASNEGNEIDTTAKTLAPELVKEKSIPEVKIEKNNYGKEIDDALTNSALTRPPTISEGPIDSTTEVKSDTELKQYEEKSICVLYEESTSDFNNATCVLKNTEANHTLTEVHTEDEDTIEGPFLEADGFSDQQKVKDFDSNSNMMQFDFPPVIENDDNIDNGELFIDAEAFEFLLNQNKTNVITNSGKESLFLKFDPLYSKRISSDDVLAAVSKIKKRHSTPIKVMKGTNEDLQMEAAQPSSSKTEALSDDYTDDPDMSSMTKPMMVVNPAINPTVSPRKVTPKINRQSLTFTSPAIAVIDRLLCLSGNTSMLDQNTSFPPRGHNDTDIAITQLRELLAEKEIHVHNLRSESKDLNDRLASLETQMKSLESESEKRLKKVNDLNECLLEKTKINRSMAVVVEEYERTIASLITEIEQDKKRNAEERNILIKERDEQTSHLASMEVSFNDLHSKYEKSKQVILSMKANEDTYKKSVKDFEENLVKMQNNYELLKQHATSKLNHANQELEKFNKAHESEVLKLNAMIKRKEMHITSLEETLAQKTKANEELASICDELINKVG